MLLFLAYYVVSLLATFALAYLFPWTPPVAENAPRGAVLRVTAPEGAPYEITWGTSWESQRDKVPSGDAYVDYAVPDEAVDGDRIVASVETDFLIAGRPVEDVDLGASCLSTASMRTVTVDQARWISTGLPTTVKAPP